MTGQDAGNLIYEYVAHASRIASDNDAAADGVGALFQKISHQPHGSPTDYGAIHARRTRSDNAAQSGRAELDPACEALRQFF
jgi:hypothetical protein